MNMPAPTPKNIIHQTDPLIDDALKTLTRGKGFRTRTTALDLSQIKKDDMKLSDLIVALWEQIRKNWEDSHCGSGGEQNWRWDLQTEISPVNDSKETRLEKALAAKLPSDWANQIPTSSGLVRSGADRKRNVDLAHWNGIDEVTMIELKIASDTPVYAAFEIVRNALLLCLARSSGGKIKVVSEKQWLRHGLTANLRVLAPREYYKGFSLGWFEHELNSAVCTFGKTHDIAMNFHFRQFDQSPTSADDLKTCLQDGKVYEL